MKKVVLLSTGGTIASKKNPKTGLFTAGALTGEELANLCDLPQGIDISVETVFQIPSNQMNFQKFIVLKKKIKQVFENKEVDGIVVTHGTDTLEETSYFLDLTISDERPVVLTGSQRVPNALGSDAYTNLRHAILVASNDHSRDMGVLTVFNERIFSPRYLIKQHASNVDGFASPGFGYLGIVDQDRVYFHQKPLRREYYPVDSQLPVVDIIKCYGGSDARFVRCSWESGAKGIVLEAMGRGHVPPSMVEEIANVIKKGMKVILTSSAAEGEVYTVYDFAGSAFDLKNNGVIFGKDYDSKKARIKLAVLLSAGVENLQEKFIM